MANQVQVDDLGSTNIYRRKYSRRDVGSMRSGSTVSAPLPNCYAPLTTHHSRYIAVQLLTGEALYFVTKTKSRAKEVYAETCQYLVSQGMQDAELFGLAIACDGEYLFLDPDSKLSKYAPKNWKSSSTGGLDGHGSPILVLHLRVQFYVESPRLLRDDLSRHHYYLQLRDNVLARGQISVYSSDELALLLAGYALQADFGDHDETKHLPGYFPCERYLPKDLVARNSHAAATVTALHRDNSSMTTAEAEIQYIKEASSSELCPLSHNVHLYRLKSQKKQDVQASIWLAVCARGIQIYEETLLHRSVTASYSWGSIGNLSFDRKKFEIRSANDKLTFYTSSDDKSKHLLLLCRLTHQFTLNIQTRLTEARRKEEEEKKRFRECFMYGRGMTSEFPGLAKLSLSNGAYKPEQRISVISNASSNTTSGIVSDRVQSLDGSEDDLDMDLLGKARPPGDSVESLALAHLCDGSNEDVSNKIPLPSISSPLPLSEDVPDGAIPSTSNGGTKSSPSSGGGATPATTDGSQCSSSCSTVVIAGPNSLAGTTSTSLALPNRRASTTSSLELGYSHTAQNSVLSELDLDLTSQPKLDVEDTESKKTVSDLESGVYTNSTRDTTQQTDNSSSGVYTLEEPESEAGMRARSGSNVSFHGDGSDPSEAGKGSLLTPEELSELIVGSYPCRATVSHTLDSDSDYVTLPPPPRPPPRSEASARFVTTKPHISMTSHSSVSASGPNYASLPSPPEPPPPPIPQRTYQFDPGAKMKPMNTGMPVVGKNNYLDVHASRVRNLLSYRTYQQRPPPPPVPPLATVYTSQVTRSQIEQYKQQLYSDVDYVIYPMKDPAISKQEYMDAKLAALASGYAYPPPPPYRSPKTHVVYRSAPNVAYLPVNFTSQPEHLYGYCTYLPQPSHYSSTSPLYSAASYSSSSSSLRYEPTQLIPHPLSHIPGNSLNSLSFSRTRSDENILNDLDKPKYRRLPPPPPPPPYEQRLPQQSQFSPDGSLPPIPRPVRNTDLSPSSSKPPKTVTDDKGKIIDIHQLREKSKNLDLPLISALCNDKSLIRQTNAFVMPKHPSVRKNGVAEGSGERRKASLLAEENGKSSRTGTLLESLFAGKSSKRYASSSKLRYPVSGLTSTQIAKQHRKMSSTHVHPPRDVATVRKSSKAAGGGGSRSMSAVLTPSAMPTQKTIVP